MATVKISKVLSALPETLVANMLYLVRVGDGFDFYVTDSSGLIAYRSNSSATGIPIKSVQTSDYTFTADDANACVPYLNSSTAGAFTVPAYADVPYPPGTRLFARQIGSMPVTFVGAAGVSIEPSAGLRSTVRQHGWLQIISVGIDAWEVLPFDVDRLYPGAKINGTAFTGGGDVELRFAKVEDASFFIDASTIGTALATVDLTADVPTVEVIGVPSGYGATFAVRFQQDATGGWEVTWPSNFHFVAGSDTQVQQAPGAMTLLVATTFDQGTRWECVMRACG